MDHMVSFLTGFEASHLTAHIPVVRIEMVKDRTFHYEGSRLIRCADDAAQIFRTYIGNVDREVFATMTLTTKHSVIALHTVSIGILDASFVHPREVYKPAILGNASAVLVAHNHPSGDPTPSSEDMTVTRRLHEAGKLLGIDFLDHVILGDETSFVSLKAEGCF